MHLTERIDDPVLAARNPNTIASTAPLGGLGAVRLALSRHMALAGWHFLVEPNHAGMCQKSLHSLL